MGEVLDINEQLIDGKCRTESERKSVDQFKLTIKLILLINNTNNDLLQSLDTIPLESCTPLFVISRFTRAALQLAKEIYAELKSKPKISNSALFNIRVLEEMHKELEQMVNALPQKMKTQEPET